MPIHSFLIQNAKCSLRLLVQCIYIVVPYTNCNKKLFYNAEIKIMLPGPNKKFEGAMTFPF